MTLLPTAFPLSKLSAAMTVVATAMALLLASKVAAKAMVLNTIFK